MSCVSEYCVCLHANALLDYGTYLSDSLNQNYVKEQLDLNKWDLKDIIII
jgi:hypothetical protein